MSIEMKVDCEIEEELEKLASMDKGTDEYRITVDGIAKLIDKSLDMDKWAQEKKALRDQEEKDKRQLKADKIDRWMKHGIAIGSVLLPLGVTIWGTCVSLKFEETGSVTTTMGRGFLGRLLPRK